ncbi:hypothetical protein BC374_22555 [Ensifer sp. LC13]|uniref:hypothetical protein n=1 Tax=unclassified Ensifer TaxID=2633371 RepID=UPI00081336D1|nr:MULTISPECIES: hypothetical protein [unclassified Ensifer]OCP07116.1 hypothetical protein BBX50_22340 [Ensifer sp. LC11]OCP07699.1 hypothetical protein BC374_22555 [Ensifer sp. LC13]OCP12140.1 hypothetical protein BC362_06725 [Ensifer sp. LC14]OCP31852.1 hypothetical protein BC364_22145 [Ensifer sp. LC499]
MALTLVAAGFTDLVVSGNYACGRTPRDGDHAVTFECRRPEQRSTRSRKSATPGYPGVAESL